MTHQVSEDGKSENGPVALIVSAIIGGLGLLGLWLLFGAEKAGAK
jgi:hypothetical protein